MASIRRTNYVVQLKKQNAFGNNVQKRKVKFVNDYRNSSDFGGCNTGIVEIRKKYFV